MGVIARLPVDRVADNNRDGIRNVTNCASPIDKGKSNLTNAFIAIEVSIGSTGSGG